MYVTMTTACRRIRAMSLQLSVAGALALIFIALSTFSALTYSRKEQVTWSAARAEELKKYNLTEVDLDFIRSAGLVDHKIQELTEEDITSMNETQLMVTIHSFLDNTDVVCKRRIRMGSLGDDGWEVCDDEGVRPKTPPCLVYSFNHHDTSAFEYDMDRVYKCEVHSFQTYYRGADYNKTERIFVHPFGVGRYSQITSEGDELYTLEDIRSVLGHRKRNVDLIKMDIEGNEWSVLNGMLSTNQLDNVKQLLVECHIGNPPNEHRMRRVIRVLISLSAVGFRKFYVYKNPKGSFHHPNFPVLRAKYYEIHYLNSRFLWK